MLLEKDTYRIGETIRVCVNCDNSSCGTDVKNFKVKLKRKVDIKGELPSGESFSVHDSEYVAAIKEKGCKAG